MNTFTSEEASLATILLLGRLFEALNKSGALPQNDASVAIRAAITQANGTGNPGAARVLDHYFHQWTV
ncbi:hypothetical protein FJ951_27080 [Mesorhizobium sp. B2-2-3]|uniref:hypothetical protein n=1 Tax=Mesorhizobium sp. B2-2-3 TaxID=2589963 RepID=UPI00112ADFC5|nr:hypothetical protein [Mesorhizobium sp. B2-2-3]TPM39373.1 hypothetical protein FJ951_27080 [Mesorhizobium sp. B2-2-3]